MSASRKMRGVAVLLFCTFMLMSTSQIHAQNMRAPSPEETAWDQAVIRELQGILIDAANKMRQNWHRKILSPRIPQDFPRDVTDGPHPLQLQGQLWLQFDPDSKEAGASEDRIGAFLAEVERLLKQGDAAGVRKLDNPFHYSELVVDFAVNQFLSWAYPVNRSRKPPSNVKIKQCEGIDFCFTSSPIFSQDLSQHDFSLKPVTQLYIGDPRWIFTHKDGPLPPAKGADVKKVKMLLVRIHGGPTIADEFISKLDLKRIRKVISDY